jgi:hypothetical protein
VTPGTALSAVWRLDIERIYNSAHSYSLNRLGELLASRGIRDWHVTWYGERPHVDVTLFLRKPQGG